MIYRCRLIDQCSDRAVYITADTPGEAAERFGEYRAGIIEVKDKPFQIVAMVCGDDGQWLRYTVTRSVEYRAVREG